MELEADDHDQSQVDIPCYFLCPISMQLMQDPVTVATGITYDRQNIEKWLFSGTTTTTTCPVTNQPLNPEADLTPNHTLRRLIQSWCTLNALDRIPTPKPSFQKSHILNLLNEAKNSPASQLLCLQRLRSIAHRDHTSRHHLHSAGAAPFLLSVVGGDDVVAKDEALTILQQMELSNSELNSFFANGGKILNSLIQILQNGGVEDRGRAVTLLKSAFSVADPINLTGSGREVYIGIVRLLQERICQKTTKAAAKLLIELCRWGKNRFKAVEAGAVAALIELLLETAERRACELGLTALEQLCGCADGRAELLRHGAGLAVVSKKILRVSGVASDRGVRILGSISRYSANCRVLQEMLQVGVVAKLCLAVQIECSHKIKDRVKEILRLHSRVWRDSSCIPPHLLSFYPS